MLLIWKARLVAFLITFNLNIAKCDGDCKLYGRPQQVIFSKLIKDYVLEGPILSTERVASDQECQMKCIQSLKCDKFNLGPLDYTRHHTCQILRYDEVNFTVKRKRGWSLRAQKCDSSPCENGGLCFTLDNSNTRYCGCTNDWFGDICTSPNPCVTGWTLHGTHCYKVFLKKKKFNTASTTCRSSHPGAYLIALKDLEEKAFLDTFLDGGEKVYIGLTDEAVEGTWVWPDGSKISFDPKWHHGDKGTEQNCAEYVQNHGFHRLKCKEEKPYVCEYALPAGAI